MSLYGESVCHFFLTPSIKMHQFLCEISGFGNLMLLSAYQLVANCVCLQSGSMQWV